MKKLLAKYIGEKITLDISGGKILQGILIEIGSDILVFFNGKDYLYIPLMHIQNISMADESETDNISSPVEAPQIDYEQEISLRKILTSAKGMFVEIYVTSNQPLHGYITSIMNNYFVFYSPVYKTMLISLNHLKWLIPYTYNRSPYSLANKDLPLKPVPFPLARSFDIQMEKHIGELVIFNIGNTPHVIGKLNAVQNNLIELITSREEFIYLNLSHIKTVHFS